MNIADDEEVQYEALMKLRQQSKGFYAVGIGALIKRWDKWINIDGEYVKK